MLKKISFERAEKLFKEGNFKKVIFLNPDGSTTKSEDGNRLDLVYHVECGGKFAVKKNLMDYVNKKYHSRIESIEQLPDEWDDEKQRFHHKYKIICKNGWGFDTGGGFSEYGYPETVKDINEWFKEFSMRK